MIDAPTVLVIAGAAVQAVPPIEAIVAVYRRRRATAELVRSLPWTPTPRPSRDLEQLVDRAAASLDATA